MEQGWLAENFMLVIIIIILTIGFAGALFLFSDNKVSNKLVDIFPVLGKGGKQHNTKGSYIILAILILVVILALIF